MIPKKDPSSIARCLVKPLLNGNIKGNLAEAFKKNPLFETVQTRDYESDLSLTEPFDMSLNSWKMVGNTVLTNKFAR